MKKLVLPFFFSFTLIFIGNCELQLQEKYNTGSIINTAHLDSLYEEINVDNKTISQTPSPRRVGIIYIYSEYPDYKWVGDTDEGIACIDDAARAVVFYLEHSKFYGNESSLIKAKKLLEFIMHMQADNGFFYNFIFDDYSINGDHKNSINEPNWWSWRAMWALSNGYLHFVNVDKYFAEIIYKSLAIPSGFGEEPGHLHSRRAQVIHGLLQPGGVDPDVGEENAGVGSGQAVRCPVREVDRVREQVLGGAAIPSPELVLAEEEQRLGLDPVIGEAPCPVQGPAELVLSLLVVDLGKDLTPVELHAEQGHGKAVITHQSFGASEVLQCGAEVVTQALHPGPVYEQVREVSRIPRRNGPLGAPQVVQAALGLAQVGEDPGVQTEGTGGGQPGGLGLRQGEVSLLEQALGGEELTCFQGQVSHAGQGLTCSRRVVQLAGQAGRVPVGLQGAVPFGGQHQGATGQQLEAQSPLLVLPGESNRIEVHPKPRQ